MIYTFIPYAPKEHDKDLAWAYNECMKLLPNDDDWACFIDHDAMFTTPNWYHQLNDIIKKNPQYSCFTVATNRVAASWQIPEGVNSINHDIGYHRDIGVSLQASNYSQVIDITKPPGIPFSGVVILYKKSVWKKVPFEPYGPDRITGVDNLLHTTLREQGHKVGLMCGVYVYHWYRTESQVQVADATIQETKPDTAPHLAQEKDKVDMDVKAARHKIDQVKGGDFVIIGVPLPYTRNIDLLTCLWVEYQKRKDNMMALYEPTRFASHGRNNVIHKVLKHLPGVTHVFFVDNDVLPPVDAIERLLAHDKDVVVGATPIYKAKPVWSVMEYDPDETIDNVFNAIPYTELPKKLFRAHHFGGTTVLIKRHVLEEMQYPWYQDVFAPGALLLGQDLYFTAKAKRMGFELWCDPSVQCEHIRQTEMKAVFDKCCLDKESVDGTV